MKINPLKPKYFPLYMDMAIRCAEESVAEKRKVGSVLVTTNGLISVGWNGMPPGSPNKCEYECDHQHLPGKTRPEVIHAERNALDKLSRTGIAPEGGIVFLTHGPCLECAKSLLMLGIKEVWYKTPFQRNPDSLPDNNDYKKHDGSQFLIDKGIPCRCFNELDTVPESDSASPLRSRIDELSGKIALGESLIKDLEGSDDNLRLMKLLEHDHDYQYVVKDARSAKDLEGSLTHLVELSRKELKLLVDNEEVASEKLSKWSAKYDG